jgi:hypothetical protein
MKQRLTYLLPFVALAALAASNGCGDDDDDTSGSKGAAGSSGTGGKSGTGGAGGGSGTGGGSGQGGGGGSAGAGQGGGGAGGAGQGGGGAGGVPNVVPADTCEMPPFLTMPAGQLATIVANQEFGEAKSDYEFTCQGKAVSDGPDLVFGVTTSGVGAMTVRVTDTTEGLGVTVLGLSACGSSLADELGCSTSNNVPQQFLFSTKGEQTTYIAVEANTAVLPGAKFSIEGYFNQALTGASADSCAAPLTAISIPVGNLANTELTDKLVTGTTTGAGGDFDVTPIGKDCVGVSANAGEDEVIAVTPEASGTLFVTVDRAPGETKYTPVVSIRNEGCNSAPVACGSGGTPAGTFLSVTGGQTYHIVIDSFDAATSGQYLALVALFPLTATVATEPYKNGSRFVVRDAGGRVLRTIDRARHTK